MNNKEVFETIVRLGIVPVVAAVGGTWLAKKEDLVAGNWPEIRRRCEAAVQTLRRARASSK